jgi:hypothetical protein
MPSSRPLVFHATLLAVLTALIAPAAASAQAAPGALSFLGAGASATPSKLTGQPTRGAVFLTLRNASTETAALRVRFVTDEGEVVDVDGPARSGVSLELSIDTEPRVAANSVQPLGVEFVSSSGSFDKLPGGVLVVDLAGEPLVAPASIAVTAPEAAKTGFFQDSVETTVTRGNLWDKIVGGGDSGDLDVPVRGDGDVSAKARLVSDRDGHLTVALGATEDGEAPLSVSGDPSAGKYSGKLQPAGADPLGVTVHVQDWFVWPLLFVLAGIGVGWALTWSYENRSRRRQVTELSLSEAVKRYAEATKPANLTALPLEAQLDVVLSLLRSAKYEDDFADAEKKANELLDKIEMWLALEQSLSQLGGELARLSKLEKPPGKAQEDTSDLLLRRHFDVANGKAAVDELDAQTSIIKFYADALEKESSSEEPARLYALYPPQPHRQPAQTRALTDRLIRLVHELEGRPKATKTMGSRVLTLGMDGGVDPGELLDAIRDAAEVHVVQPFKNKLRSPQEIRDSIRFGDKVVFWVQAAIIIGVYMATLYIGQDFGGGVDYLTAFGAGVAGKVVIPWELFPLARSTRPPKPKAD